jgi:hypothetical protein
MPRLCSMIVRLTPTRSKADHVKTSMLQLRQERSLASSFGRRSSLIKTVCLGVAWSRGTVLVPSLLCSCVLIFFVFGCARTVCVFAFCCETMHITLSWDEVSFYVPGCLLISIYRDYTLWA